LDAGLYFFGKVFHPNNSFLKFNGKKVKIKAQASFSSFPNGLGMVKAGGVGEDEARRQANDRFGYRG
jgi:hypothetical protein